MTTNNDVRLLQRCEGRYCPVRDACQTYRAESHPSQPWPVDYSQAPGFKPSCAKECCPMYKPMETVQ